MEHTVFTVVLTGGIASGKTTVSDRFAELGVPVIDTDLIAREVVEPGQPALGEIAERIGRQYLDSEGCLDRRKMREAIFANPAIKQRLESILHPRIALAVRERVEAQTYPYCLLVIPLYSESKSYDWVDRVLVVDVSEEIQIERVMRRDRISRNDSLSIIAAQASREERLTLADDVLDNSGSVEQLQEKVGRLHRHYLQLAQALSD